MTVVPGGTTGQYVAVLGRDHDLVLGAAAMDVLDGIGIDAVRPRRRRFRHATSAVKASG